MSKLSVSVDGYTFEVDLELASSAMELDVVVDGQSLHAVIPNSDGAAEDTEWLIIDGRPYEITVDSSAGWIKSSTGVYALEIADLEASVTRPKTGDRRIKAPIPGMVSRVLVGSGQAVQAGQPLFILEAMKMENEIRAPFAGIVKRLNITDGQVVALQELLAEIE
jgi:biotin carboxyl carrier protein